MLKDLDIARLEQEYGKENVVELLANLNIRKAKMDEALDNTKNVILAKRDLKRALVEATTKRAREEALKLSSELGVARVEDVAHCGQADDLGAKKVELLAMLKALQMEIEYFCSDTYPRREEFERFHYARGDFVKALSEVGRALVIFALVDIGFGLSPHQVANLEEIGSNTGVVILSDVLLVLHVAYLGFLLKFLNKVNMNP
ncbi:hypothetical protein ACLOJK_040979 [Asimina triloba]